MNNHIEFNQVKFWKEDDVLYCKFEGKKRKKEFSKSFLEKYLNTVSTLSDGRYLPLIIDLRELKDNNALSVIRILAKNPDLKSAILSKSFVVNNRFLQLMLILLRKVQDPVIPNKVFKSYKRAISYSQETNHIFNA